MNKYYLIIGSVTHAIMARDLLRAHGINARSVRTPAGMDKKGCGYSILLNGQPDEAVRILESGGIRVTSVVKER